MSTVEQLQSQLGQELDVKTLKPGTLVDLLFHSNPDSMRGPYIEQFATFNGPVASPEGEDLYSFQDANDGPTWEAYFANGVLSYGSSCEELSVYRSSRS